MLHTSLVGIMTILIDISSISAVIIFLLRSFVDVFIFIPSFMEALWCFNSEFVLLNYVFNVLFNKFC